jgi:hypothetical protein
MARYLSIGLFTSAADRPFHDLARGVGAALAVAIAVIGLLVTAAAPPLLPAVSTVVESTGLQPSADVVVPQGVIRDRGSRANDDDYLEGLVRALDDDS